MSHARGSSVCVVCSRAEARARLQLVPRGRAGGVGSRQGVEELQVCGPSQTDILSRSGVGGDVQDPNA